MPPTDNCGPELCGSKTGGLGSSEGLKADTDIHSTLTQVADTTAGASQSSTHTTSADNPSAPIPPGGQATDIQARTEQELQRANKPTLGTASTLGQGSKKQPIVEPKALVPDTQTGPIHELPTESLTPEDKAENPCFPLPKNSFGDTADPNYAHGQATEGLEIGRENSQKLQMNIKTETVALPVEPGHIAKELFAFCINAYQTSFRMIRGEVPNRARFQEEMGRFALWGDGCAVPGGELDLLFKDSKNKYLKESTIISLCSIAKTLDAYSSQLNTHIRREITRDSKESSLKPDDAKRFSDLAVSDLGGNQDCIKNPRVRETKTNTGPIAQKTPNASQDGTGEPKPRMCPNLETLLGVVQGLMPEIASIIEQDLSDSGEDLPGLQLSEVVEDIKDSLDSLFDLVPSIDELYLITREVVANEHGQARVSTVEPTDFPIRFESQFYKVNIRDKFPEIEEQLAETLAEINWTRHQRVREWAESHENQDQVAQGPSGTIADSGIGSSNFTFQSILAPTQKNPFSDCKSEVSATSFGTTNSTFSGKIRVPKAPVPLLPGITFKCSICFKMLRGVDTSILWKKHVLRDLRPYSCLFGSCPEKVTTFESRKTWMAHEFKHHRPQNSSEWRCSGACVKAYRKRDDFAQHVLRDHLEGTVTASDIDDIVNNLRTETRLESIRCPFCAEYILENKRSIQCHIGTHMDEIALKALPLSFDCESNASSDDEASIGDTTRPKESLESGLPLDPDTTYDINCICGISDDDGFTICCKRCETWQHCACVQITNENMPKTYYCTNCLPGLPGVEKAKDIQGQGQESHKNMALESIQAIEEYILDPINKNPDLSEFQGICVMARDQIQRGLIHCLRDLEKFLINTANTRSSVVSSEVFLDASLSAIQDAWPHVLEFDRVRQTDAPYSECYFLDSRHQYGIGVGKSLQQPNSQQGTPANPIAQPRQNTPQNSGYSQFQIQQYLQPSLSVDTRRTWLDDDESSILDDNILDDNLLVRLQQLEAQQEVPRKPITQPRQNTPQNFEYPPFQIQQYLQPSLSVDTRRAWLDDDESSILDDNILDDNLLIRLQQPEAQQEIPRKPITQPRQNIPQNFRYPPFQIQQYPQLSLSFDTRRTWLDDDESSILDDNILDNNLLDSAFDMSPIDRRPSLLESSSAIFSPSNDWDFDHDMGMAGPADDAAAVPAATFEHSNGTNNPFIKLEQAQPSHTRGDPRPPNHSTSDPCIPPTATPHRQYP